MKAHPARIDTIAVAAGIALALGACAPGGSSSTAGSPDSATVSTDVAAMGEITLTLSDFFRLTESDWMDDMIARFETKYPNITIDRTEEDWGKLVSTLNVQLQDDNGPDIASANNGWQSLGVLGKGGLVRNLDAYADAYEWDQKVPSTFARQYQFTTDFSAIGEGSWYAQTVARTAMIGIYYNSEKLKALGLEVPSTLAEFEAAAAAAHQAGEVPISYNSLDGNTAILLALQAVYGDKDAINGFTYGDPKITAAQTGLVEATTRVKNWNDNGWLSPNHPGIGHQDAGAEFLDGSGVFRFEYTGSLGLSGPQLDTFGFIQLPQVSGDSTVGVASGPGAMVISARCDHPDAAAAFLDFLMSPEAAQAAVDFGLIPALNSDVDVPPTLSLSSEAAAAATLDADDGYVAYFDWTSPTMLVDVLEPNLQVLYAGKMTPEEFVAAVDANRDAFLAEQNS